ncbi:MAG: hypothetical protein LCH95_23965 [Proteobacteria bacterium]|nr:hypothetical protein [Pseudomonadota bacterium]
MSAISNIYLTHGAMLLCALACVVVALPEGGGRIVAAWRVPATAVLAGVAALLLVAYPTWGELKNPELWMFSIVAGVAGVARGFWMQLDVDHAWHLLRLTRAADCRVATFALAGLALVEVGLAFSGPADQPTMELGMTVIASFLIARAAAVMVRARQEPQSDLHDRPSPPVEE